MTPLFPSADSGVHVGPFILDQPVGVGGMAEVWRGRHVLQNIPVAIKVVHAHMAQDPTFVDAMRNEVLSVARLQHPRVVMVLDQGLISAHTDQQSGGRLRKGSPYLTMELASGGTLHDVPAPLSWRHLRAVLLAVMDALAHAHARGVIHRDLKPSNVLLCTRRDMRPGIKLSDFGLACPAIRALDLEREEHTAGTPQFMAPEQLRGEWRDYGPWTDLYALGCMTHQLVTGHLPFDGEVQDIIQAQLFSEPPALPEGTDIPPAFSTWLRRVMNKDHRKRFDRVADAVHALRVLTGQGTGSSTAEGQDVAQALDEVVLLARPPNALPQTSGSLSQLLAPSLLKGPRVMRASHGTQPVGPVADESPTIPQAPLTSLAWDSQMAISQVPLQQPQAALEAWEAAGGIPPLPRSWRTGIVEPPDLKLLGAGLGLFGVRSVPLVGREGVRDLLWDTLRQVNRLRRPQVVVLRGAAGMGKTRLAEWMCQRMAEVGAATVMQAVFGAEQPPTQGLNRMLALNMGSSGLPYAALSQRVERLLRSQGVTDAYEWEALTHLVGRDAEATHVGRVLFATVRERHALIRRQVERTAQRRAVVVWLDDVHHSADALEFCTHMLDTKSRSSGPVLLLLTVQDEAVAARPQNAMLLENLCLMPGVSTQQLAPLQPGEHQRLVEDLLGLESRLAAAVSARTAGNPMFAVQLVGDWVQRDQLRAGPHGFTLENGAQALPDTLHQVWTDRLEVLQRNATQPQRNALELAAVLGLEVENEEWTALCTLAGAQVDPLLVQRLLQHRFWERADGGFRFVHGMLRESLERTAREAGRLQAHHAHVARMLKARASLGLPGTQQRLGYHLLESGQTAAALSPMLRAVRQELRQSAYAAAGSLLDKVMAVLGTLDRNRYVARWAEAVLLRAEILTEEGRFEEARQQAALAQQSAPQDVWVQSEAAAVTAHLEYQLGHNQEATAAYLLARLGYNALQDTVGLARSSLGLGDAAYQAGDMLGAAGHYKEALERAEGAGDLDLTGKALWGMGYVHLQQRHLKDATSCFQRQLSLAQRAGNQSARAHAYNALGEVYRALGRFDDAEEHYRACASLREQLGAAGTGTARLNVVLCLLQRQSLAVARQELDAVWPLVERAKLATTRLGAWSIQAALCAHEGDWARLDDALTTYGTFLAEHPNHIADCALVLQLAGKAALERDEPARALRALGHSVVIWEALGRAAALAEVNALVASARARSQS